jgi:hypothetical protein
MINDPTIFDEDYYINGKASGKSLYENYRWMPELTVPMVEKIAEHLEVEIDDSVLDFGCARGYSVKAFTELGFAHVAGCDVSEWAINNCDPSVKDMVRTGGITQHHDWIIAKDVLEHIPFDELKKVLHLMATHADKGVFIVVPLSDESYKYVVPEYEMDITHAIRWTMNGWLSAILESFGEGWEISARYRIKGIKDNYSQFAKGNGFITIKRIT